MHFKSHLMYFVEKHWIQTETLFVYQETPESTLKYNGVVKIITFCP